MKRYTPAEPRFRVVTRVPLSVREVRARAASLLRD